jgi:ribosomal peptide maturation radical SAM protein 1
MNKIALISTPWPFYNRPSIQLGSLKSFLKERLPDLGIDALHLYLQVAEAIGYELYQGLSEKTWVAESLYAALLFPERSAQIRKFFYRQGVGKPIIRHADFDALIVQLKDISDAIVNNTDWKSYSLAGFSVCLCQLTSSLYFIRKIKERFSKLFIAVGGSACAGALGKDLLRIFSEIDFVVNEEGEIPLYELVYLLKNGSEIKNRPIPGVLSRNGKNETVPFSHHQINNLDALPVPDYDDYFALLKRFTVNKTFFPTLPMEISRGCWWNRKGGCAFCNLNLQWRGYRSKSPSRVATEVDRLTARYQTLSVTFMDNLLPGNKSGDIFQRLQGLEKDLNLFGEIRASTPLPVLESMRKAGMRKVQIGIEALSSRLLKKMNKGTTAIENIEVMRHCEELGIVNTSNLILYFPGSDEQDVNETLRNLDFVLHFYPLKTSGFWLGFQSPVYNNAKEYGMSAVFNHPHYKVLFPPQIHKATRFMVQGYRGRLKEQKRLWKPVIKKVNAWKKAYASLRKGPQSPPCLTYEDGKDFLIIRQRRYQEANLTHRLTGTSRKIYLFCRTRQSVTKTLEHFPKLQEAQLILFLNMMVRTRLMFEEGGEYLSLAVSSKT